MNCRLLTSAKQRGKIKELVKEASSPQGQILHSKCQYPNTPSSSFPNNNPSPMDNSLPRREDNASSHRWTTHDEVMPEITPGLWKPARNTHSPDGDAGVQPTAYPNTNRRRRDQSTREKGRRSHQRSRAPPAACETV